MHHDMVFSQQAFRIWLDAVMLQHWGCPKHCRLKCHGIGVLKDSIHIKLSFRGDFLHAKVQTVAISRAFVQAKVESADIRRDFMLAKAKTALTSKHVLQWFKLL